MFRTRLMLEEWTREYPIKHPTMNDVTILGVSAHLDSTEQEQMLGAARHIDT